MKGHSSIAITVWKFTFMIRKRCMFSLLLPMPYIFIRFLQVKTTNWMSPRTWKHFVEFLIFLDLEPFAASQDLYHPDSIFHFDFFYIIESFLYVVISAVVFKYIQIDEVYRLSPRTNRTILHEQVLILRQMINYYIERTTFAMRYM